MEKSFVLLLLVRRLVEMIQRAPRTRLIMCVLAWAADDEMRDCDILI